MRYVVSVALLALALTACGGDGTDEASPAETSSSTASTTSADPAPSATPTVAEASLRETCPQVEAALPPDYMPRDRAMLRFAESLPDLYRAADLETTNALDLLIAGTEDYLTYIAEGGSGTDFLDARAAFREGLEAFATRCAAAGSSALQ